MDWCLQMASWFGVRQKVETGLEWGRGLHKKHRNVGWWKQDWHIFVHEVDSSGTMRLQRGEIPEGEGFQVFRVNSLEHREYDKEGKKHVKASWSTWRNMGGRWSARMKGDMYKRVVREWCCMRQEDGLDFTEMKMLRFSLGVTWMDGIRPSKSEGCSMFWRQRPGWDGWDWRTTANLSVEGWNWGWSCQAGGLEEDQRRDLWIYGWSKAVRTPEGNSWKEETVILFARIHFE